MLFVCRKKKINFQPTANDSFLDAKAIEEFSLDEDNNACLGNYETNGNVYNKENMVEYHKISETKPSCVVAAVKSFFNQFSVSSNRLTANIYKDLLKCIRNKKLLIIQFLVPIIQITFFCLCIGQTPQDLPIGIFNEDLNCSYEIFLGEKIIQNLNNQTFIKKKYSSFKDGYDDLKNGVIWSLLHIDRGFSEEVIDLYAPEEGNKLTHSFKSLFHIYSDNTNDQISLTIKNELSRAMWVVVNKYASLKTSKNEISLPIKFEKPVYGEEKPVFTFFMAPGIALSVIFFMSVASTASNFVFERKSGLTERSFLSGVRTIELLFSQLIVYSILMLVQVMIIICLLFVFLKLPLKGSLILLVFLITSQGFSGLCYGLCLASILHNEETVIQVTLSSFYPILLVSGIIWPIESQPGWLKDYFSRFSPLTYATDAFRAILEKEWNLTNFVVIRGFLTTYIYTFLFAFCFLVMFSRRFKI